MRHRYHSGCFGPRDGDVDEHGCPTLDIAEPEFAEYRVIDTETAWTRMRIRRARCAPETRPSHDELRELAFLERQADLFTPPRSQSARGPVGISAELQELTP